MVDLDWKDIVNVNDNVNNNNNNNNNDNDNDNDNDYGSHIEAKPLIFKVRLVL
jgi:hypothetical protein